MYIFLAFLLQYVLIKAPEPKGVLTWEGSRYNDVLASVDMQKLELMAVTIARDLPGKSRAWPSLPWHE
jgi:hypothetical protein